MKKRTRFFLVAIGVVIFCGWTFQNTREIKGAQWLIGTWENKTQRGSIFETWKVVNEREFSGKSYILKEKDTIVFETIQLVQEQNALFYIPTVKNQNDGLPVRFALKTLSEKSLVFENQEHDFPQIISYTKISGDSLVAEISGVKNGQARKQQFPMKKVK